MRAVIQRVLSADVNVDGNTVGKIGKGLLILLGVGKNDTKAECDKLTDKISKMRIFSDENDKINLSVDDVSGDILVVSQFTLYADCRKGNRPSFTNAGDPETANELYEYFSNELNSKIKGSIQNGIFGADMKVNLVNDGPFTVILDTDDLK